MRHRHGDLSDQEQDRHGQVHRLVPCSAALCAGASLRRGAAGRLPHHPLREEQAMSDSPGNRESIGGLAISSADWQKIHALEGRVWAKLAEAKVNLWGIKKALGDDLTRLVKAANGIN